MVHHQHISLCTIKPGSKVTAGNSSGYKDLLHCHQGRWWHPKMANNDCQPHRTKNPWRVKRVWECLWRMIWSRKTHLTMGNPILGIGDLGWIMSWAKHQHWLSSVAKVWIQCGHLSQVPATVVSLWFPCVLDLWSKGNPSFPKILWSGLLSQQGDESLIHIAWVLRICLWMMRSPRVVISIKTTRKSSTRGFLPMSQ